MGLWLEGTAHARLGRATVPGTRRWLGVTGLERVNAAGVRRVELGDKARK